MKYGALRSPYDIRDYVISTCNTQILPEKFQLLFLPKVKDQGSVNSCVAHVAAEIEEYYEGFQCNDTDKLSPGFIYGTRYEYTGPGMYCRDALKTLKDKGICKQSKFTYNIEVPEIIEKLNAANITLKDTEHCRISSYYRCKTAENIKSAIYNYGPVLAAVDWYDDNSLDSNYILKQGTTGGGGHALLLYGWNENGFLFQNSWSTRWGNEGRAILPYSYPIYEAWGIIDNNHPQPKPDSDDKIPVIVTPTSNTFIDIISKMLNATVNFIRRILRWNKKNSLKL